MGQRKACCFTGSRTIPEDQIPDLRQTIQERIRIFVQAGGRYFACGGNTGFDLLAAEEVLRCKKEFPQIRLVLLLPFPGYTGRWAQKDQERFARIWPYSTYRYLSEQYYKGVYKDRDEQLIHGSSTCIGYLHWSEPGWIWSVYDQAETQGLWIQNLAEPECPFME